MNTNGNDLVLYAVDVVVVIEFKIVAVAGVLIFDLAAVDAVASALADGVLRLAEHQGLLSTLTPQ